MPIIKKLAPHVVSAQEAFVHHFDNSTDADILRLSANPFRMWRFVSKFQKVGSLAFLIGRSPKQNDYERGATGRANEMQDIGRTACGQDCALSVCPTLNRVNHSTATINAECRRQDCPEIGLEAAALVQESTEAYIAEGEERFVIA